MQVSFTVGKPGLRRYATASAHAAVSHRARICLRLIAIKIHWDGNETMRLVRRDVDMNQ
jgi:hypothetical protein